LVNRYQSTYFPQARLSGTISRESDCRVAATTVTYVNRLTRAPVKTEGFSAVMVNATGEPVPWPVSGPTAKNGPCRPRYAGIFHRLPCALTSKSKLEMY